MEAAAALIFLLADFKSFLPLDTFLVLLLLLLLLLVVVVVEVAGALVSFSETWALLLLVVGSVSSGIELVAVASGEAVVSFTAAESAAVCSSTAAAAAGGAKADWVGGADLALDTGVRN